MRMKVPASGLLGQLSSVSEVFTTCLAVSYSERGGSKDGILTPTDSRKQKDNVSGHPRAPEEGPGPTHSGALARAA